MTAENTALSASQAIPAWRQAPWGLWVVVGSLTAVGVVLVVVLVTVR